MYVSNIADIFYFPFFNYLPSQLKMNGIVKEAGLRFQMRASIDVLTLPEPHAPQEKQARRKKGKRFAPYRKTPGSRQSLWLHDADLLLAASVCTHCVSVSMAAAKLPSFTQTQGTQQQPCSAPTPYRFWLGMVGLLSSRSSPTPPPGDGR